MFLSNLDGDLGISLELQQGSQSFPVAAETRASSLVVTGYSGFA